MVENQDINTILVAVDFTPFSEEALCFAGKLADKLEAQLIVLHVIHDPAEAPGFYAKKGKKKEFLSFMEDVANEMMEEFLNKMRRDYPNQEPIQKATPLLVTGTPATRIVEIAEKKQASMIVVGSHGRTGLSHLLIGSKAERVVQLANVPVTVVKPSKEKCDKLFPHD
jgi:nucleotide-binding universal stress UspA family protein